MSNPIRTLILPAAGFGTRMRPVDPNLPKELLPLGPRQVIEYALLEAVDAEIRTVVVITRHGKEILNDHLRNCATQIRILLVHQDRQGGEGDAIAQAREHAGNEPFAVLYPDNVGYPAPGMLREVCEAFERTGKDTVALMRVTPDNAPGIGNSGRVRLGPPRHELALRPILEFLPKGPGSYPLHDALEWRTCGLFVTLPHFFEFIELARRREFSGELTDGKVRRVMRENGVEFLGAPLSRMIYDVGNPEGYARLHALLRGSAHDDS
jgi:UTP--glucose-1-phosphate uridylyltransferase